MKNILITSFALLLLTAFGCQSDGNVHAIMSDEAQRQEVYNMIVDNDEMQQEMMQVMRDKNSEGMMENGMMGEHGMMGKDGMMGSMNRGQMQQMMQQMMDDCAQDSANCSMMSKMMLGNSSMMHNMMMQMHEKGMMNEACYQQMMSNMSKMEK
ncbi:hypothetical protein ACXYMU_06640 [Pontibacter sp. CAU 1760]